MLISTLGFWSNGGDPPCAATCRAQRQLIPFATTLPIHSARSPISARRSMALSVSSLAAALSHLSLPLTSTSKPHPAPLLRLRSTSRRAASLALRASAAEAAEPSEADLPAEEVVAVEEEAEEDALSGIALRKYVKQRLPGGFAAQRITATGRRKTAIARVVLQEGTGKVFINFRDAKVPVNPTNARTDYTNVAPLCRLDRIAICSTIPANLQLANTLEFQETN